MLKVNGKTYSWGDVELRLPGIVTEVQEISYDDELEKEVVYGMGSRPRGYGRGNYKANGKITLLRDDYDDIVDYCKKNGISLYELEFPKIIVSYAKGNGKTVTDILNRVSLTKSSTKAAQGDKSFTVDFDLLIAGLIERDGVLPVSR